MNKLTTRQKKLVYLGGIVALLIPIILLGMPAGQTKGSGGALSRLRQEHDLGESTLGNVDPSSAAMNLVLLGLRGPAASVLRLEAEELQKTKNWGKLRAIVDAITLLQPHFVNVWQFEGWNLAYNVSQAWDATEDRYYWVKEGIKFQRKGSERNQKSSDLIWHTARLIGWKIGQADEWKYFRKYFIVDPDEVQYGGGPDPELNPLTRDHWLVSKDEYARANQVETLYGQHVQARHLFRQYPARVQIEYAQTLQKEGQFDDTTRIAWEQSFLDWTGDYGREEYFMRGEGGRRVTFTLESWYSDSPDVKDGETEEMKRMARENFPELTDAEALLQQQWVVQHHAKTVNYDYWRRLTIVEKDQLAVDAHRHVYLGKKLFREGRTSPRGENGDQPSEAREELEKGMAALAKIFEQYPQLAEDSLVEEGLTAVQYWLYIHQLNGIEPPTEYPLKAVWEKPENQQMRVTVRERFRTENSLEQ